MLDAIYPQVRCARSRAEEGCNGRLADRWKAPDHYKHLSHLTMVACGESPASCCLARVQPCRVESVRFATGERSHIST
jgi:hypothetical protein